jgi:hypothetical protein
MAAQHLHSRAVVSQLQVHLEHVQLLPDPSYSSTIRSPRSTSRSRSTLWYSARLRVTTACMMARSQERCCIVADAVRAEEYAVPWAGCWSRKSEYV